jgi:tyrosyl-tRNA synthetase
MDVETKIELVMRPPASEVVTGEELKALLETNEHPRHYIGFEISGMLHLGSGYITAAKIRDLEAAGFRTSIFFADYHTWINRKLGGDLETIKKVARTYYQKAFESLGLGKTNFVFSSDLYRDLDYWTLVIGVANEMTLARVMRTLTIMGRKEKEVNRVAQLLYTPMQIADMFFMDVDLAHAGMDQRKAHMAGREIAPSLGKKKPVALHHSLLMGLLEPRRAGYDESEMLDLQISSKMSKSKPGTCIFIHDSPDSIRNKMRDAFCPPKETENNPVLEHCRLIVFRESKSLEINRPAKYGGKLEIHSYEELQDIYRKGELHPMDLKGAVAEALIKILEPPRRYFEAHPGLLDVFKEVKIE